MLFRSHDEDAKRLAELGYKQQFDRRWTGFSNFAISFSIISILSGCFTTFGQAWNNGGPVAISIGWPIIAALILVIGLCMSELVSAMPTSGGIYYWSFKLGKPVHGWLTGWLNLAGLVAVIAGVDYGFATFFVTTMNLWSSWWDPTNLSLVFEVFVVTVVIHILLNVFGARIIHFLQTINVYWHVVGVAAIVLILILIPDTHQSASWVFTERFNNSGFSDSIYWFYVLPLGFLLTQYTITGFDASAHVSEETGGASKAAAQGLWRSIFFSGVGGWIMLLSLLFAATHVQEINDAFGFSPVIFLTALVVNLRFVIFSALLGPHFSQLPLWQRFYLGYISGDVSIALFLQRYPTPKPEPGKLAFLKGLMYPNWVAWQIGSLIGIFLGSAVPTEWQLGFAGTLAILCIMVPLIVNSAALCGVLVAGVTAVLAHGLPYKLGLLAAVLAGMVTAMVFEETVQKRRVRHG